MNENEVKKSITIPGHNERNELLYNLSVEYNTQENLGDVAIQPIRIENVQFLINGEMTLQKQTECLKSSLDMLAIVGVQSQEYLRRCEMYEQHCKDTLNEIKKWEQYASGMTDKINSLIEQGIITQEQFDGAMNNKTM